MLFKLSPKLETFSFLLRDELKEIRVPEIAYSQLWGQEITILQVSLFNQSERGWWPRFGCFCNTRSFRSLC